MTTENSKATLYDRKASREENDLIISRMNSTFQAAKLRNTLYDKPPEEFHTPVDLIFRVYFFNFNSCY